MIIDFLFVTIYLFGIFFTNGDYIFTPTTATSTTSVANGTFQVVNSIMLPPANNMNAIKWNDISSEVREFIYPIIPMSSAKTNDEILWIKLDFESNIALISFSLFSIYIIRKLYDLYQRKKNNYPPGTNGLPLIGVLIPFIKNPLKYLQSLQKYGEVVMLQIGLRNCIIVNDSKLMSKWLSTTHLGTFKPDYSKIWNKDAMFLPKHDSVYGTADLLSGSNKIVMRTRRQVSSVLIRLMNTSFLQNMAGPYLHSVIFKDIDKCIENTSVWHLHKDIRKQMFNSMHIGCFGQPLDPQSDDYKLALKYIDSVNINIPLFVSQSDFYDYTIGGKISSFLSHKILHSEFVNSVVELRKLCGKWCKKYDKELLNNNNKEKLVGFEYLKQYHNGGITEAELYELMATPFLVGVRSVSTVIERVLIHAAMYPEQQQKVYEELKNIYPSKKITLGNGILSKLHYLRALTKEALRMFDGVPLGGSRLVTKDTSVKLSNGDTMILPKNSIILCNIYSMNMSNTQQKWHSNTPMNKFDINRWIDSNNNNKFDTSLKVHTFGAGKRGCVGRSLAERELYYFIAEILRNYKLSLPPNANITMKTNIWKTCEISPVVVQSRLG